MTEFASITAEQNLLGAAILNNEVVDRAAGLLKASDFFDPLHGQIWDRIAYRRQQDMLADVVTLGSDLAGHPGLAEIGGPAYLVRLAGGAVSLFAWRDYATEIAALARKRRLADALSKALTDLNDPDRDAASVLSGVEAFGMTEEARGKGEIISLTKALSGALRVTMDARDGNSGMPTGIKRLDEMIGGFRPGDLVILGGRPGMGKSSVALALALNAAREGFGVAFASLEMPVESLALRAISAQSDKAGRGVAYADALRGTLSDEDFDQVRWSAEDIVNLPIRFIPPETREIGEIHSAVKRCAKQFEAKGIPFGAVIIDYLQLLRAARNTSRFEAITEISIALKQMALTLKVPVIALSQLSRGIEQREDRRPIMSDLRECLTRDAMLTDADTGSRVSIADVRPGQRVLSVDTATQRVVPGVVVRAWPTGVKPVFRVQTASGRTVMATANHPLLTGGGWKHVGAIAKGEDIALQNGGWCPPSSAGGLSPDLCRLLGLMCGDGTYKHHREVGLVANEADAEVIDDFRATVARHFPTCSFRQWVRNGGIHISVVKPNADGHGRPYGNPFREWLRGLGILGEDFSSKRVPPAVFLSGREGMAEFLCGYLHADGTVKKAAGRTWRISFSSCSVDLLDGVREILDRLGIPSSHQRPTVDSRSRSMPLHCLSVSSHHQAIERFRSIVPSRFRKGALLAGLDLPTVENDLAAWADSDLRWDHVVSVEPAGEAEVFDIQVAETHSFIANGIVVHNSGQLEQDADVILFCYREEYYLQRDRPDGSDPEEMADWQAALSRAAGWLDIIVAKQRMGETGAARVHFEDRYNSIRGQG